MPSCGKQLQALKELNLTSGPVYLHTKPQGIAPTPLIPISLTTGVDFVGLAADMTHKLRVTVSSTGFAGCEHTGAC